MFAYLSAVNVWKAATLFTLLMRTFANLALGIFLLRVNPLFGLLLVAYAGVNFAAAILAEKDRWQGYALSMLIGATDIIASLTLQGDSLVSSAAISADILLIGFAYLAWRRNT